jgi:hypothetical protein
MATLESLVAKVRVELGDLGKSFVSQFVADGSTNRFKLHYAPLDGAGVVVYKRSISNGSNVDISDTAHIEESTGVMVLDAIPADGDELTVSGTYYRYFTDTEIQSLVTDAFQQHVYRQTDSTGRKKTLENLPSVEEYPVAIYAVTLALYTLATDAAFDIDVQAPDGVTIPRAERYRQLMQMMQTRQDQYRDLCTHLGIGMYKIDTFTLRRVSKGTGRYIPVYTPQEVDDRSYPQRVHVPEPTYGNIPSEWPTEAGELTAYQGRSFSYSLDVNGNYAGKYFIANLLSQRGSVLIVQPFTLSVSTTGTDVITAASRTAGSTTLTLTASSAHGLTTGDSVAITNVDDSVNGIYTIGNATPTGTTFTVVTTTTTALSLTGLDGQVETNVAKDYTFILSLDKTQTLRTAERTYWSLSMVDAYTSAQSEIRGGKFFTVRASSAVL